MRKTKEKMANTGISGTWNVTTLMNCNVRGAKYYHVVVHWVPLTTSKTMQKKLLVVVGARCNQLFDIVVNEYSAQKSARYSRVLVVNELIISGTQCNPHLSCLDPPHCTFPRFSMQIISELVVITARVRSTREGTVFTGVCLFTSVGGGGTPSSWRGGRGVPSSQVWMGDTPFPGLDWGDTPFPGLDGRDTPFPGLDGRVPPSQVWTGGTALPEQHSVYLLRSGRYASCVYAGWLSCVDRLYFACRKTLSVLADHVHPSGEQFMQKYF